eukprot:m.1184961 g.1184961  ORF g.1184961 m.1184961 type:complete len:361 (+) comp24544_c1_seq12:1424-2506(+)
MYAALLHLLHLLRWCLPGRPGIAQGGQFSDVHGNGSNSAKSRHGTTPRHAQHVSKFHRCVNSTLTKCAGVTSYAVPAAGHRQSRVTVRLRVVRSLERIQLVCVGFSDCVRELDNGRQQRLCSLGRALQRPPGVRGHSLERVLPSWNLTLGRNRSILALIHGHRLSQLGALLKSQNGFGQADDRFHGVFVGAVDQPFQRWIVERVVHRIGQVQVRHKKESCGHTPLMRVTTGNQQWRSVGSSIQVRMHTGLRTKYYQGCIGNKGILAEKCQTTATVAIILLNEVPERIYGKRNLKNDICVFRIVLQWQCLKPITGSHVVSSHKTPNEAYQRSASTHGHGPDWTLEKYIQNSIAMAKKNVDS